MPSCRLRVGVHLPSWLALVEGALEQVDSLFQMSQRITQRMVARIAFYCGSGGGLRSS